MGTFGVVKLSRLRSTGRFYAVKIMNKRRLMQMRQCEHIRSEREVMRNVTHSFIVHLHATFQDASSLYMVSEFVPGGELFCHLRRAGRLPVELFCHLRRAGRLPVEVAKFYAAELILTLGYLHSQSIVYRDLKPENLLLDRDGNLKITDFGFAKVVSSETYTLVGTPEYLAPEIIAGTGHGKAVDWWALGILIYEMLAGYPPFSSSDPYQTSVLILEGKLAFPKDFDRVSIDLITKLLHPDRHKRLGASRVSGTQDVMSHQFFYGLNWLWLEKKFVRAPIVPRLRSGSDTFTS
ncbi:hypothetical protein KIPB_010936, partial [Kipferlia bialata]|eukprot:g10936.t1